MGNGQHLNDRHPPRVARARGDLVAPEAVGHAAIAKKQQAVVVAAGEEVRNHIILFHPRPGFAASCPALSLKGVDGHPLDIALLRYQNEHLLVGNQVNVAQIALDGLDGGAARGGKLVPDCL